MSVSPLQCQVSIILQLTIRKSFMLPQLRETRKLGGDSVKICAWVTVSAAYAVSRSGPESIGGMGDVLAKVDAEAVRTGKVAEMIFNKVR